MVIFRELRSRSRHIVPPVAAISLLAYFVYHAVQGERGLFAWMALKQELVVADAREAALAERRVRLERRVALLHPDHLDLDMLEERAQSVLNFGREEEYIILLGR